MLGTQERRSSCVGRASGDARPAATSSQLVPVRISPNPSHQEGWKARIFSPAWSTHPASVNNVPALGGRLLPAPALRTWRPFPMRLDFWISSGRVQCQCVRRYSRNCLHATSSRAHGASARRSDALRSLATGWSGLSGGPGSGLVLRWLLSFFVGCGLASILDRAVRSLTVARIPHCRFHGRYADFAVASLQVHWHSSTRWMIAVIHGHLPTLQACQTRGVVVQRERLRPVPRKSSRDRGTKTSPIAAPPSIDLPMVG